MDELPHLLYKVINFCSFCTSLYRFTLRKKTLLSGFLKKPLHIGCECYNLKCSLTPLGLLHIALHSCVNSYEVLFFMWDKSGNIRS